MIPFTATSWRDTPYPSSSRKQGWRQFARLNASLGTRYIRAFILKRDVAEYIAAHEAAGVKLDTGLPGAALRRRRPSAAQEGPGHMAHHGRVLHGRGRGLCAGVLLDARQAGLQSAARPADYRLAVPDEGAGGEAGGRMSRKSVRGSTPAKCNAARWYDPEARLTYKNTEGYADPTCFFALCNVLRGEKAKKRGWQAASESDSRDAPKPYPAAGGGPAAAQSHRESASTHRSFTTTSEGNEI